MIHALAGSAHRTILLRNHRLRGFARESGKIPVAGIPTASAVLDDGTLVEMLYDARAGKTSFAVCRGGVWTEEPSVLDRGRRLVPFSTRNNLVAHEIVLFPSKPQRFGDHATLVADLHRFVHRHLDVSPEFERLAVHYILFTWLHDRFNELPYLRARGDFGSGKTRFLQILGSLCYRPIFASGSSTVSPVFRILDAFRGTLVLDEADFRMSDEKAELTKILNNGSVRGFPVLRSEATRSGEFNPTAFHVFGPKLVATRGEFEDPALESRFLTEPMGLRPLREDVPINLPSAYRAEALELRNKLLAYRFENWDRTGPPETIRWEADAEGDERGRKPRRIDPRLAQVLSPLMAVMKDDATRAILTGIARRRDEEMADEKRQRPEALVLELVREMREAGERLAVKTLAERMNDRHGEILGEEVTPRWVGGILRKLGMRTRKSHGVYVVV